MPDVGRINSRAIVNLKVAMKDAGAVATRLQSADTSSLNLGPDTWLLVSDSRSASDIVADCEQSLDGLLMNAVDYSSGLAIFKVSGPDSRELLAMGTGLDLRPTSFATGSCSRTRLAQIAVVVVATGDDEFELYLDRSFERYFDNWLRDSIAMIQCLFQVGD